MKLLKKEHTAYFDLNEEAISNIKEEILLRQSKAQHHTKLHAKVGDYNKLHSGVVNALFQFVNQEKTSTIEKVLQGDTSPIRNWDEIYNLAPWALECLKDVVNLTNVVPEIHETQKILEESYEKSVGEVYCDGKHLGTLNIKKYFSLFDTESPCLLTQTSSKYYWLYCGEIYSTTRSLSSNDIHALIIDLQSQETRTIERAHAVKSMKTNLNPKNKRQPIPQDVKMFVWQRDSGRCVQCQSQENLEYDHIIPLVMGGSNTERNLQLLCEICNNKKGGTLG